ncbi:hypothetical protein [Anaerocolumna jejuensis]|uniref:hypothetical protein n=1 Tax=Anaerocolumna jejuensis TaxID=259063 RepID=UPI003F7B8D30
MNIDSVKKKFVQSMTQVAKKAVSPNVKGWPPVCTGLFYQVRRPKTLRREGVFQGGTKDMVKH